MHFSRKIAYHAVSGYDGRAALKREIVRFVRGIRGARECAVTQEQIVAWFRATDAACVRRCILDLVVDDVITIQRSSLRSPMPHNTRYTYAVVDARAADAYIRGEAAPGAAAIA